MTQVQKSRIRAMAHSYVNSINEKIHLDKDYTTRVHRFLQSFLDYLTDEEVEIFMKEMKIIGWN